ncbi:hypothetical protein [Dactylosporangium cerinum]
MYATRPLAMTTAWRAIRRTTARFCSTSSIGTTAATACRAAATSVTTFGARPFVGSSMSSSRFGLSSTRPIASICCWPPDRVPARCRARLRSSGNSPCTVS